jgi:hypothetical protein
VIADCCGILAVGSFSTAQIEIERSATLLVREEEVTGLECIGGKVIPDTFLNLSSYFLTGVSQSVCIVSAKTF